MLENLKALREAAAVSQKQLADAIGVSQQSINKYENHNIEPDIGTLIRIADYFDTSVDYLVGHTTIRRKIEQTASYELNEEERESMGIKVLPTSLWEAYHSLEEDPLILNALGSHVSEKFLELKYKEWDEYRVQVFGYEQRKYLDI